MTPMRLGPYTVRQETRLSDRLLHYVIWRSGRVVGYSASVPDRSWCEAVERFAKSGRYAEERPVQEYDYHLRGVAAVQRGRPTKAAVARREAELLKVPEGE